MLIGVLILGLQLLHRSVVSEDCTGLPPDKTYLTVGKSTTFPIAAGNTVLVKCRDDELVLHGSLHLTCLKGITYHFQSDPVCEPAKGHSVWLIVGIVVGLIVIVTAVLGGVYFYFKSGLTT